MIALVRRVTGPLLWWTGQVAVLEVPGRRTGTPRRVTLFPIEVDETRYLVSQYGISEWVRNLRAVDRARLSRKGQAEDITAVEIDGPERDQVIAAYLAKLGGLRRDFDALPAIDDHPTFRVEPIR